MRGNIGTKKKSAGCLEDVAVLAFSYPILGMRPRTGELKQGALSGKEGAESVRSVLTTRVRPKGLDSGRELDVNHDSEETIKMKQLAPMMHKVNPRKMSAIINKQNIISISSFRNERGRAPYIRVNQCKRLRRPRWVRRIGQL